MKGEGMKGINKRAKELEEELQEEVFGMSENVSTSMPIGCTTIFDTGWETNPRPDSPVGNCISSARDFTSCSGPCWWLVACPDSGQHHQFSRFSKPVPCRRARLEKPQFRHQAIGGEVMKHRSLGILAMVFVLCALAGAFSPAEAKDFLFVPVSNALQIVDCDTDTVVKTVPAYNDYIVTAAPSADGKRYYLNAQHSIYVIDTATHQLIDTFRLSSDLNRVTVLGFAVSEDGSKLYLSCSITKKKQNVPKLNVLPPQLLVFDIASKQVVQSFEIPYCVSGVFTLRNDPNHLMLVGLDIHKIQLSDGKLEKVFGFLHPEAGAEPANNFVIWYNQSPGDPGIFVNAYYTPSAMYFLNLDRNTGEIKSVKASDIFMLYSCVLSPDKKYIYAAMDDVVKFDAQTGATIKSVPLERGTSYAVSITSDGKKLYVGPSGADMSVFDTSTMTQLGTIPLEADGVAVHRISQ